ELVKAGRDNDKINRANEEYQRFTARQADKLKALVRAHGDDPAAFDGILVLVGTVGHPLDDDMVRLVLQRHLANPKLGELCFHRRYRTTEAWAEAILRETAAKHPEPAVRGQAVYALGDYARGGPGPTAPSRPKPRSPSGSPRPHGITRGSRRSSPPSRRR